MNNKIYRNIATLFVGGALMFSASCTDKFEDFNTDPKAPTPGQMEGDYANTASLLGSMIPAIVQGQENSYQMLDQMIGCEYGRMTAAKNHWGTDQYYGTYNPPVGWTGNMFDTTMPQIYTQYFMIRDLSNSEGLSYYWALLVRVAGSLRVSDCYGPIPYSKIGNGSDFAVAYDDMKTLYNAMFADLDVAITGLKESAGSIAAAFADQDCLYGGDVTKWIKLGNTIKLRMAMRLVNVEPALAQAKAEEAVSDAIGVITSPADAAWSNFIPGGNAFHKTNIVWNEGRVSADLTSYMSGYNDPRLALYAQANSDSEIVGMRNGIFHAQNLCGTMDEPGKYARPNVNEASKLLCISASETWFARAEGALRGWNMGGTAKELYEQGIETSMSERGAALGNYLTSTATPADYEGYSSEYNISAVSTATPAWNESGSFDQQLEQIMVQKWIGNYPNGWETWADVRRTGYPKFFPVYTNMSTAGVSSSTGMCRLPYPMSEFNTNEANVKAAQAMLGGPDTGATKLWWAK